MTPGQQNGTGNIKPMAAQSQTTEAVSSSHAGPRPSATLESSEPQPDPARGHETPPSSLLGASRRGR